MSGRIDIELRDGEVVRTRDGEVEVVREDTGLVVEHWEVGRDAEVRVDGLRLPRPGEVETR